MQWTLDQLLERQPEEIQGEKLYEGKAKALFTTPMDGVMLMHFKDDATAFDGKKHGFIKDKGYFNAHISALLLELMESSGVRTHFLGLMAERYHLVRALDMFAVEVVVRNVAAGSLARRLGFTEGYELPQPVLEFYYKDDALSDPWLNRYHIRSMGLCTDEDMDQLEAKAWRINEVLREFLRRCNIQLVDFKLEFGRTPDGEVLLGDEITPDTCRFWDLSSGDKLDKDRFRQDLGDVESAYQEVLDRVTRELSQ